MRNNNLLITIIAIAAIVLVAVVALLVPRTPATAPEATGAKGYVYITAGQEGRWFELPQEETNLTLRRTLDDGSEVVNVVALTPDGAYMLSSTCENQDCVEQGHVTLENKASRVLSNLVLCLPNEVVIELFSPEEITAAENQ